MELTQFLSWYNIEGMTFIKGQKSWNIGKPRTEEEKLAISTGKKGKPNGHLGMKRSEKVRRHISESLSGRTPTEAERKHLDYLHLRNSLVGNSGQFKKGKMPHNRGEKLSQKWRKKLSVAKMGKPSPIAGKHNPKLAGINHWNWQGGITKENEVLRKSLEYKIWRQAVYKRDNYLCIFGGEAHGNKLQADHIKPWAKFPELRFEVSNGRTLCAECHRKTDTWGGRIKSKKLT